MRQQTLYMLIHKPKFHLTRLDSTPHVRRVEPMHFGCVELVEQHSSTRSTRQVRLARHDERDWLDTTSSTGSTRRARLARHDELDWLDSVELDWLDTTSSTGVTCNLVMITVIHV